MMFDGQMDLEALLDLLHKVQTELMPRHKLQQVAYWDCPECGVDNQLITYKATFEKDGYEPVSIWACADPDCDTIVFDVGLVKGYYTLEELITKGFRPMHKFE